MHIHEAEFVTSAVNASGWPAAEGRAEIAFCGRSNVGKSTLLNNLLSRRSLARVSRTPGRTRLINFFLLRGVPRLPHGAAPGPRVEILLADLPGFGYAKVAKSDRVTWRPMIQSYLTKRESLRAVVLLIDSRRVVDLKDDPDALNEELDLAAWLVEQGKVVLPVMTKSDKLKKHERKPVASTLHRLMGSAPVIFSAHINEGSEDLWRRLQRALQLGPPPPEVAPEEQAPEVLGDLP